jgi:hypothetical protein
MPFLAIRKLSWSRVPPELKNPEADLGEIELEGAVFCFEEGL